MLPSTYHCLHYTVVSSKLMSTLEGLKPLEIGGSGGAIHLPYLVLHLTVWSTLKAMSTF